MTDTIMRGCPPPTELRPTLENWDLPPMNRWAFQHVSQLIPTARVHRGHGPRSILPEAPRDLDGASFTAHDGAETTIAAWLDSSFTDGFIVLHRGTVVYERYMNGMDRATLHLSESVAKSVTAATAGVLIGQGVMDPDASLTTWVPEFRDQGYDGATLRHVMDMQSGVAFSEDYTDPDCDCSVLERVSGWRPRRPGDPGCMFDQAVGLTRARDHGERFEYRSIETEVLGICMERATGERLADLVSRLLWDPLGVDEDARFTVDPAGQASASGGFNATLRDYARFGEMLTRDGHFNGQQIVPSEFIAESRQGDQAKFIPAEVATLPNGAYRNQFWNEDVSTRVLMGLGIFGQFVYSDPDAELTAVKLSTWPEPLSDPRKIDTLRAIHAIKGVL